MMHKNVNTPCKGCGKGTTSADGWCSACYKRKLVRELVQLGKSFKKAR